MTTLKLPQELIPGVEITTGPGLPDMSGAVEDARLAVQGGELVWRAPKEDQISTEGVLEFYASCTDTSALTFLSSAGFTNDSQGVRFPYENATETFIKRIKFDLDSISDEDTFEIQVSRDREFWVPHSYPSATEEKDTVLVYSNGIGFGAVRRLDVPGLVFDIYFGSQPNSISGWAEIPTYYWRARIVRLISLSKYSAKVHELEDTNLSVEGPVEFKNGKLISSKGVVAPTGGLPGTILYNLGNDTSYWGSPPAALTYNIDLKAEANSVLEAPEIGSKARYVHYNGKTKELEVYSEPAQNNGWPISNEVESYTLPVFDDKRVSDNCYTQGLQQNDYIGWVYTTPTIVDKIQLSYGLNINNDNSSRVTSIIVETTQDGISWYGEGSINHDPEESKIIDYEFSEPKEILGFRIILTSVVQPMEGKKVVPRVRALDALGKNTIEINNPFVNFRTDTLREKPIILSYSDGYDSTGDRSIVDQIPKGIISTKFESPNTDGYNYLYAEYDKVEGKTSLSVKPLISDVDSDSRWYFAGNIATRDTAISSGYRTNYPPSGAFTGATGTAAGSSWISGDGPNSAANKGALNKWIGQSILTGTVNEIRFYTWTGTANHPLEVAVEYSINGENWFLIKSFAVPRTASIWVSLAIPNYYIEGPHHVRLRALTNASTAANDWCLQEVQFNANIKRNPEEIVFNTRRNTYSDENKFYNFVLLSVLSSKACMELDINIASNMISDSVYTSMQPANLAVYNTTNYAQSNVTTTNAYFGIKNVKPLIGKELTIQWQNHATAAANSTSVILEIQRDNNPAGTWEPITEQVAVSNASNAINTISNIYYECDTVHCIRLRTMVTMSSRWAMYWLKFFEALLHEELEGEPKPVEAFVGEFASLDKTTLYQFFPDFEVLGSTFETDWFAVGLSGTYVFANPLGTSEVNTKILYSPTGSFSNSTVVFAYANTIGASTTVTKSDITVKTGTAQVINQPGVSQTTGYYKLFVDRIQKSKL